MRSRFSQLTLTALILAGATFAACTPNLDDKLSCLNSTQCPTGYFCGTDGKCQAGDTVPEITVLTPTMGITFSGVIALEMSVIDPAGVSSVSVSLSGPMSDGGSPVAAASSQNNIYTASLDTRAMGISSSGSFTATILATNAKGKSSTATVQLQVDDQPPLLGNVQIAPAQITAGQATLISFNAGEPLTTLPVVTLTPPDHSGARHAAYVSVANNSYSYQFIPLPTDPLGAWTVQISAVDSEGNSSSTPGLDSFTVIAGGAASATITAVRGDGATGAQAYYLKAGATLSLTAVFGTPLEVAPGAFICPVGTAAPCQASTTGSSPFIVSGSGTTYTFQIPAVVQTLSPVANEGVHVLSVIGSTQGGATVIASANVIFDFTAPSFTVQDIGDGSGNTDAEGRKMVSFARDGSLLYAALINEPLTALGNISAATDNGDTVPQVAHPTMLSQIPQFSVTLGGNLASIPPVPSTFPGHDLQVTICDLAGNCATENSEFFVEVDKLPAVVDFDFPIASFDDSTFIDGGLPKAYRAGQTITVGLAFDRELESGSPSLVFEPFGDQSDFIAEQFENYTDGGSPAPFGYAYQTTISPNTSDGAYPVVVALAYDGYGNNLIPSGSTMITSALTINVKTSVPVLLASNSGGGLSNAGVAVTEPSEIGFSVGSISPPLSWYFVSQSNGSANPDDDLTTGTISVCIDPALANGAVNCSNSPTSSSGGLTATVNPSTANRTIGRVDFTTTATPVSENHFVVISFTDEAGNVGVFGNNLSVNGTGPVITSVSLDKSQVPPLGTATLTLTVADPSAIPASMVTGSNLGAFGNVTIHPATSTANGVYSIGFTMPAQCNGLGGNPSAAAFGVGAMITDLLNLSYSTPSGAPLAMIACVPAPTVTSAQFDKTILYPGEVATATVSVDEALGNIGGTVTGFASVAGVTTTTTSQPNSTTPRNATVKYTMPAACLGVNAPGDGVPFTAQVKLFDGANTTALIPIGTLTCQNEPRITSYSWSNTIVASGTTATATLAVNEPLASAFGTSSPVYTNAQLAISPSVGATAGFNPLTYTISVTPNCGSGGVPEDVPIAINATIGDGVHTAGTSSLGTITCIASTLVGATVNSTHIALLKQPYSDGTVRSTVSGGPNVLTGLMGGSKGISLLATDSSGNVLGSGPLSVDPAGVASVAEFQIANGETQPVLAFTDLLGHSLAVPAGYSEELDFNGTGLTVAGITENPFQLYDVSTGDDAYYTPSNWLPAGPNSLQAARLFAAATAQKLADIDDSLVVFGDAGTMSPYADAGIAQALIGEEPFGNPLITDAGTQITPGARNYGAMAYGSSQIFNYNTALYMMGGSSTDQPFDLWSWNQTSGWSAFAVNASANSVYPQPYNGALLLDQYSTLYSIGGGSTPDAGFSNDILQAVTAPGIGNGWEWQDAGNLGVPGGFGLANPGATPFNIASYTSGLGALDAGVGSAQYESIAVLANSVTNSSTANCLMFLTAGGYGINFNSVYTCSSPTSNYGSRTQPAFALVPYPPANVPSYTIYMFGGSGGQPNSVSNDLLGGATTYVTSTEPIINTNWALMPVNSAKIPPVRHGGSLYFIPDTNHLGLYGGVNAGGTALTDAWEYDLTNGFWVETDLAPEIGPTGRAGAAKIGDENGDLYQYGGIPAGGSAQSDGWTFVRESRNRFIAKLPINTQLTNSAAATFSGLDVTVAAPSTFRGGRSGPSQAAQPLAFLSTTFQIYAWTGTVWTYVTSIGEYVNTITVPWSALTPGATDGNVYVMVTAFGEDDSPPPSLELDAVSFALHFK